MKFAVVHYLQIQCYVGIQILTSILLLHLKQYEIFTGNFEIQ
jgi:hypothetical protein